MLLKEIERQELNLFIGKNNFVDYLKYKKILITGYRGLIGTGLVKWLLRLNDLYSSNIRLYLSSRNPSSKPSWIESSDNVEFTEFLKEKELGIKDFDIIIHLAAPTDKKYFINNPLDSIDSIYEGTKYYLELAKEQKGCQFLYASSVEAYGCPTGDKVLDESYVGEIDSFDIRNGYPIGKRAAEYLCYTYFKAYGLKTYVIRPSSVQGLFQKYEETRIFNEFLRCILEDKDFIMKSDGLTKKSMVYTLDTISAIFYILERGNPGEAYNITNPDIYYNMNEYVELLFKEFNNKLKLVHVIQNNESEGFLARVEYNLSVEKLKKLGWKPLADIYHIYRADIEMFKK